MCNYPIHMNILHIQNDKLRLLEEKKNYTVTEFYFYVIPREITKMTSLISIAIDMISI